MSGAGSIQLDWVSVLPTAVQELNYTVDVPDLTLYFTLSSILAVLTFVDSCQAFL